MKFVDSLRMSVKAGRGGNGCMSFLRERFKPNGGPDGGNGGRGGSVIFEATTNLQTLADLEYMHHIKGENGGHGKGAARNGPAGEDKIIYVPCGTVIYDADTGEGCADLVEPHDRFVAARGGRGGRGNRYFASSSRKAPRFCEQGDMGEEVKLRLELRLIADVGLVGLPNVGKSSILAAISNAQPRIANYPFTTLSPNLGVLNSGEERIVIADIPGLIEGAHMNKGLGLEFLRHVDRSRLLIHVLSLESRDYDTIIGDFEVVRREMEKYDPALEKRPYFVAANKLDELEEEGAAELIGRLASYFREKGLLFITVSALTEEGIPELVEEIIKFTAAHPRPKSNVRLFALDERLPEKTPLRKRNRIQIISLHGGGYQLLHYQLEKAAERYDFSQDENVARFTKLLRRYKVEELLEAAGAQPGDSVTIGYKEFNFYPDYYPDEEYEEKEAPEEEKSGADEEDTESGPVDDDE
ncbi:MAG: GTPase ObgE [Synergistaceae bacterium]|nr:GTPase ObgE [Synergistaceae bacterium]